MIEHYVYTLARPDGRVFYVGKGSGDRMYDHAKNALRGEITHRANVIRKIWVSEGEVVYAIIFRTTDELVAYAEEARVIDAIGLDNLTNQRAGGRGGSVGFILSEDARRRISDFHRGRKRPLATRQRMSAAFRGRVISQEMRQRISLTLTGRRGKPHTDETRQRMSRARKAFWDRRRESGDLGVSQETKDRLRAIGESRKGKTISDETRRRMSAAQRKRVKGESERQNIANAKRARSPLAGSVSYIKEQRANGKKLRELAAEFGVSESTICNMCKGKTWRDVT